MEEQIGNVSHKNFKFKELRVYASTEWLADNKKKYRQVFDRYETTYVYCELSFYNKLFDIDHWDVDIELRCYEIKNQKKQICALQFKRKISKFDNEVFIREGWGNKREGSFWKKGTYFWEAWIDGIKIATKYFYIEDVGDIHYASEENAYINLHSIRLYEGPFDDLIEEERKYFTTFSSEESRYIYAEIDLQNKIREDNWHCELFVKFYNESRELKGQVVRLHNVKKNDDIVKITAGWGANLKGSWKTGQYSIEVSFMEKLLGMVYFDIGEENVEGTTEIRMPNGRPAFLIPNKYSSASFTEVYGQLDSLVGLHEIKKKVKEHAQYIEFLRLRKTKGFKEAEPISIHSVFTGNPGTGKTSVAKMMGILYKKIGLLSKGHVLEVDRADLVGEYIGQTAPKAKETIEKARGGVLFIDEAYSLARTNDDSKDFGREVIEILIKEMSNGKGDIAIIVAGYPKEMKHFIQSNPGLGSRFKHYFDFPDYLPLELIEIAQKNAVEQEISFTEDSFAFMEELIYNAYRDRDRTFGNARYVIDLLEKAKINLGLRIMARKNPLKLSKNDLKEIVLTDVLPLKLNNQKELPSLPIDKALLDESLASLNSMIGIESVKAQIEEMVSIVRYYRESGRNVLAHFSLHTILVGNPGTGKTTVARLLAKIYKALGILERGHIVETDRQGLVAGFIGQTAIKTAERIDEALGGVLFIDEAYALSNHNGLQGDYGNEAIQTMLKRMEDLRGEFFVIVAGYPDNMHNFLKSNPGLNSRFDKTLTFEDYTPQQLMLIAQYNIAKEGYQLEGDAETELSNYLTELYNQRDKYFGNGRVVRKLILDIIKYQNLRIGSIGAGQRKKKMITTFTVEDVRSVMKSNEKELIKKEGIGFRRQEM